MSALVEKNLIENLKQYLISHGYPENSIITEYKLGKYRADLVVIDNETNSPMQLFELKSTNNKKTYRNGEDTIKQIFIRSS